MKNETSTDFYKELYRREIVNCNNIEAVKEVALLLLEQTYALKEYVEKLAYDDLAGN